MKSSAREFLTGRARLMEETATSVYPEQVEALCETILACLRTGGRILIFGNGGSAALALHFSGELVGRFRLNRRPLPAIALAADLSALTAIGNDYTYEEVFSRQVVAHGRPGDLALGLTTSGRSPNVVVALKEGRRLGLRTALLTGSDGGSAVQEAEVSAIVPSRETDFIQEAHEAALHFICHRIDAAFPEEPSR